MTVHFPFQNTYAALPANFFARVAPTPVASPRLIKLNRPLAVRLRLDPELLSSPEGAEILAGKRIPDGADPIAIAYAGHQFGHFVPHPGDGAILLAEVIGADGVRLTSSSRARTSAISRRAMAARRWTNLAQYIVARRCSRWAFNHACSPPSSRANVSARPCCRRGAHARGASHIRVGTFRFRRAACRWRGSSPTTPSTGIIRSRKATAPSRCWKGRRPAGRSGGALALSRLHPRRHEHRPTPDLANHRLRPCALWTHTTRPRCSPRSTRGRYTYANQPQILL